MQTLTYLTLQIVFGIAIGARLVEPIKAMKRETVASIIIASPAFFTIFYACFKFGI